MSETSTLNELRLAEARVRQAEGHIAWILDHPGFSDWLKTALRDAIRKDPVHLANDLELLGHLLRSWSRARIEQEGLGGPSSAQRGERAGASVSARE